MKRTDPWSARYDRDGFYCELFGGGDEPPDHTAEVRARLAALDFDELTRRAEDVARELYNFGITFTVYTDREAIDRILPFDVIPRVLSADEFSHIEAGVIQRVTAINMFLDDVYHDGKALRDGIVPNDLVYGNPNYRKAMQGLDVPCGTYVHICGTDLVRGGDGVFVVLEDNARTPSGVSLCG